MSAPVDVLAVMDSDAHCAAESRERHYNAELVSAAKVKSEQAREAVRALIADNDALREGIAKALDELADAGPKALKYAEQELRAALAKVGAP